MDYDFNTSRESLKIPLSVYQPIKHCQFCQSVFINDQICESCGRSMQFHLIGEPFGPKSYYAIKERYVDSLNKIIPYFPFLENKSSIESKSYIRKIEKRFTDLISAYNSIGIIEKKHKPLFLVESMAIIDELLIYNVHFQLIESLLNDNDNSDTGLELLAYLHEVKDLITPEQARNEIFLNHQLWGTIKVEFFLKVVIITASVIAFAVSFRHIISSQFGK
jgi:hypothetical protein